MNARNEQHDPASLRQNVKLLGRMLGDVVRQHAGEVIYDSVESIRQLSKNAQVENNFDRLFDMLGQLDDEATLQIARAFSQFLNLANIAEQHHSTSDVATERLSLEATLSGTVRALQETHAPATIAAALDDLHIDLVLTAHPTEITRRTLIHKHREINACLGQLDKKGLSHRDQQRIQQRLRELIAQIWHTEEFRTDRPTPIDEARWAFAVIENSLWDAVPAFFRTVDSIATQAELPARPNNWQPIQISSWIGGDRDGNPNVTAEVTTRVLMLARWEACDLFLRDVATLYEELSVTTASTALQRATDYAREPYRYTLRQLRARLVAQRSELDQALRGEIPAPAPLRPEELLTPLTLCYDSLIECGIDSIANGLLLDTLYRARCFGPYLIKLDIRQESGRHRETLSALTNALGLGDYDTWSETERRRWLRQELLNPRPLIADTWQPEPAVAEVLNTFRVIAKTDPQALGCYVISMASQVSDVLAVQLLLKATGCSVAMPVAPLFETLDDLDHAASVIDELLADDDYRSRLARYQVVMIGYSDSAKDAGMLAAGWAQYRAQESLLAICDKHKTPLQLFHGRGGTIGRGGAPAYQALLSQPPGSLENGLRVTEQGEMIRTKLGMTALALNTLGQYASAILQANLVPPPEPANAWRLMMDRLAADSCEHYRNWVRHEPNFVTYFRQATPEQELASLPLGSRPARRRTDGGIESLRAIPWIFAWSQNRLMLPAWLGAGAALQNAVAADGLETLQTMHTLWPFFRTRLSMLEMVFAKTDLDIALFYDRMLVVSELKPLGTGLRQQLQDDMSILVKILEQETLLQNDAWVRESISLRDIYTAPLNLLQAELLRRVRETHDPAVEQALMVTIAGVAAGMRNTG